MRKLTASLLLIIFLCSSCTIANSAKKKAKEMVDDLEETVDQAFEESSKDPTDKKLEQILAAIPTRDQDAIRSLFSQTALAEAEQFDQNLEALFDVLEGEVVSVEDKVSSAGSSWRHGKRRDHTPAQYFVTTTEETYHFFLEDYPRDQIDPENEGLYALRVMRFDEEKDDDAYYLAHWGTWQDMSVAGIYIAK